MTKSTKILISLFVFLIILALSGIGWILFNKKIPKNLQDIKLPAISQIGTANTPGGLTGPTESVKAKTLSADKIIALTNEYRAKANLPALKKSILLTQAADIRTKDMFDKQYFEHTSPDGTKPSDVVLKVGYDFSVTGENIALGDFENEQDLVDAWYASPGHRANILNPEYTEIGVFSDLDAFQGNNKWISTQEFAKMAAKCTKPNQQLSTEINQKTTEYKNIQTQLDTLNQETQSLIDQANQKIAQGNTIYKQTHSKSKAQPFWDEGQKLSDQVKTKTIQIAQIDTQLKDLFNQINDMVNQFNTQVSSYNKCIKN